MARRYGTLILVGCLMVPAAIAATYVAWAGEAGTAAKSDDSAKAAAETKRVADLKTAIEVLRPLHTKLGKPQPGEWLDRFDEPGQTFDQYLKCDPAVPQGKRSVIYIQPLGNFTPAQREIVRQTADFMGRYYGLKVTTREGLPLSIIPAKARRKHPQWGMEQVLTTYVLDDVLKPRLPDDAAAYIAFTTSDLWPGEGWNFVFGQASLKQRVGVWSIYRNGSLDAGPDERRLCLLRTIKTAVHETGHMFSMRHCTAYECCMCGSNHREEADRRPLWLCPECMAKACWATRTDPVKRYEGLRDFCRDAGLTDAEKFYGRCIVALTAAGKAAPAAESRPAVPASEADADTEEAPSSSTGRNDSSVR
ncbi:MAG: hypothetical protein JXL80_12075 [Planctomycetes bacterium]|nr:hypothetical protein [Planctomycetota bacterium]